MEFLANAHWTEYELIDSGGREKLERFGKYVLARPEPQAIWSKGLPEAEWENLAQARYTRTSGPAGRKTDGERGEWLKKPGMPDQWTVAYRNEALSLVFRLGLTSFGHVGIFPEQAGNWEFVYDFLNRQPGPHGPLRVLNLFAYTGGASLAARAAGAEVTHVDSVKPVITWARELMEASGLEGIRWVVEDALKFARREARRGNLYDGILLDPPAYGRGPEGEKWVLEESIDELMGLCSRLLRPERSFFVLSLYSMGLSSLIAESLVRNHFPGRAKVESGEFYFSDRQGRKLPLGTFTRFG